MPSWFAPVECFRSRSFPLIILPEVQWTGSGKAVVEARPELYFSGMMAWQQQAFRQNDAATNLRPGIRSVDPCCPVSSSHFALLPQPSLSRAKLLSRSRREMDTAVCILDRQRILRKRTPSVTSTPFRVSN